MQLLNSWSSPNRDSSTPMLAYINNVPDSLTHATIAYALSTGFSSMLLLSDGSVATELRVQDVVSYGVAGAAGLAITTTLLFPMLNATMPSVFLAVFDAAECACAVLMRVATQVLVSVAVAERELKLGPGNVFHALLLVGAVRFVDAGLNHAAVQRRENSGDRLLYVLRATQGALLCATCYVAWGRLGMAMVAEMGMRAVM